MIIIPLSADHYAIFCLLCCEETHRSLVSKAIEFFLQQRKKMEIGWTYNVPPRGSVSNVTVKIDANLDEQMRAIASQDGVTLRMATHHALVLYLTSEAQLVRAGEKIKELESCLSSLQKESVSSILYAASRV